MDVATTCNTDTCPPKPTPADRKPQAASRKASATDAKPNALSVKTSPVTANAAARPSPKLKSGTTAIMTAKPRAANSGSMASNNAKASAPSPGTPTAAKPKSGPTSSRPVAPKQTAPAELVTIHRKAIQSIDAAGKAMSVARTNVESAKSSKKYQNKVVAKANRVIGALLTPSRHVVHLLNGLGALFPPCKQVSITLGALAKHEVDRYEKDVRVAIVHFDLARALVHIGSLNRKSRPTKSIGEPLNKLLKNFKDVIQEFSQFCEGYYETRGPESAHKHLRNWKSNKDSLNSFVDRIAQLKESLTSLLSQQAVQHPGKHTDALSQIESRLAKHRAFFATIRDANEEIAEALLSKTLKQGGVASFRLVQDNRLLKQFAGALGEGVAQEFSTAFKKTTASTLKQVQEQVAKTLPDTKTTRPGVKASFASKLSGTLGKLVSGEQQKDRVDTKSGPPPPSERIQKQGPVTTHAPAHGQRTGQQQKKKTSENRGKVQTSRVPGTVNTTAKLKSRSNKSRDVAGVKRKTAEGFVNEVELPEDGGVTIEQEPGDDSLVVEYYEYTDGELEGDGDDDQDLHYLQGDEEIADELGVDGEGEDEEGTLGQESGGNSFDVEDYEYANGELEGDGDDDQELHYLQGDEEIADGLGMDGEDGDGDEDGDEEGGVDYGDSEQGDEYAGSELGVDGEGDEDGDYLAEDGIASGDEYDGSEPEGYDEGDQEGYDDGGSADSDDSSDGGLDFGFGDSD